MLISMTGFGRGTADAPFGRLIAEIQSVNRKYLEMFVSMPKEMTRFEHEVRKWVGETVSRGQLTIRIHLIAGGGSLEAVLPDLELMKGFKAAWEKLSHQLGLDPKRIDLPFLLQYLPAVQKAEGDGSTELPALHKCVDEALQALLQMKKKEGKALAEDILGRLKEMEKRVQEIEALSPDATVRMRQKLLEKIGEAMKASAETEERVFREVAIFAERVDISEEITRLKSHFVQFKELMAPKGGPVGRKIDFLIQEMGREVNTIGSKSLDAKISHHVVELKSELEKIREQIQNVE